MEANRQFTLKRLSVKNFTQTLNIHVNRAHVSTSDQTLETEVREAIAKFRIKHDGTYSLSKTTENACVAYAIRKHRENQRLYAYVMRGAR